MANINFLEKLNAGYILFAKEAKIEMQMAILQQKQN